MGTRQQPVKRDPPPPVHSRACIQGGGWHSRKGKCVPRLQGQHPVRWPCKESPSSWRGKGHSFFSGGVGGHGKQEGALSLTAPAWGCRLTFRGDANPVEVAGQLLGDVRLPPGWEAHHDNHRWGVGELRPTGWGEQHRKGHE